MNEVDREGTRFLLESWLDLGEALERQPELRRLLFDPVTGLPTTPLLFPRIGALLEERGEVSLMCINVVRFSRIEEIFGWRVFDDVMRSVAEVLDQIAGETLRDADVVAELMNSGNAFVIVLSPPRTTPSMDPAARADLARRIEIRIHELLATRIDPGLYKKFGCFVGSSTVITDAHVRFERLVYDALEEALSDSYEREAAAAVERTARLSDIIAREDVSTLLQPLFELTTMEVIGYEALTRGPEGGEFERPDKLFAAAYDSDLVLRLERICRKVALAAATELPEGRLLFLNIEPGAVGDPHLRDVAAAMAVDESGIAPASIVFELTERAAISDFPMFRSTLDYLRALGFHVAVDDAGAGYGSLQCLAEVRPEWLKIDLSLVRGCDTDEVRYALIESLVAFAHRVGAKVVAEGIETESELESLRELGVRYGQGFLLAVPSTQIPRDEDLPARSFVK